MKETHEQVKQCCELNAQEVANLLQEVEQLKLTVLTAKLEGYNKALDDYAWWKDGVCYVGSCGTTLKKALEQAPVNCNR